MVGITASGLGSGLDINGLVSQLVAAESQPTTVRLDRREASLQSKLSAIGSFKGALSELQNAISALKSTSKFEGMKATVGDESLLTASAVGTAQPGSYAIEVKALAQIHKMASGRFSIAGDALESAPLSTGDLAFDFNNDGQAEVEVAAADTTLIGIRDAINQADAGVRANIVNDGSGYRLTLNAVETGTTGAIKVTVSGSAVPPQLLVSEAPEDADTSLHTTAPAQDAEVEIDGLTVTSTSNSLSEAIQGVTLTLKQKGPTTITVAKDSATASNAVQAFVDAYNKFAETVASLTAYDATTQQGGALLGDAQVRSVTAQLRSALGARLGGDAEAPHSLSDIGVTVQRDGKLALDQAKLQKALETDSPAVANLFAGTDGLATRLDSQLDNLLTSGGPLSSRTSSLNKEIEQIGDQRDLLNQRMETLEKRYRAQFTALDQLVSQLTATGNYLTQQLANLPGASRE